MIRLAEWLVRLTYAAIFGSLGSLLLFPVRRAVTVHAGPRYTVALWTVLLCWIGAILLLPEWGWAHMRFREFVYRHDLSFPVRALLALYFMDMWREYLPEDGVWARASLPRQPEPNVIAKGEASAVLLACFALWLLGLLLFWVRVLVPYVRVKRALRRMTPADDPETREILQWEQLWLGIRGPVPTYRLPGAGPAKGVFSPCVVGLRSPALVLPEEVWRSLTAEEKDAVAAHELMHIRKRDNLRNLLLLVFHSVFWFAPVLRIALRTFRQDLEYLRDAQVLGETATRRERRRYVEAILAVAEASAKHYRPALHSGMLTGSGAGFRIRLLRRGEKKAVPAALALLLWALVFAAMPAVLYVLRHILPLEVIG